MTTSQRMSALERANEVRFWRADIKRRIRSTEHTVAAALSEETYLLETMELAELLQAQKGWGPSRTEKFLKFLKLDPGITVGEMKTHELHSVRLFLEVRG